MTAGDVEASGLQGRMRARQEKCWSASVEAPAHILAVFALAEQSLDLERQVMKWYQALVELKWNFQVFSSAALSAQHSVLEKIRKARKCRGELEDAEERLGVAQIATSKARDDDKVAREKVFKIEADYVNKATRRQNEVDEWTRTLRQLAASAAARLKGFEPAHAKLESRKVETVSLNEALKLSWKEVVAIKGIVEEQKTKVDFAGARMT